jgi:hypothetical protein
MFRLSIALFLLLGLAHEANAACGATAHRAGCVGPNGAVGVGPNGAASYNKNTGTVRSTQSGIASRSNPVAPGTTAQGPTGNTATKAVEPGCAFVNGRRVCR